MVQYSFLLELSFYSTSVAMVQYSFLLELSFYSTNVVVVVVVVYLYLTSAKCTGIAAFSLWPEATALTEMVKVELHERKKMKFYNV